MPAIVTCPECQKSLKVPDEFMGKTVRCPGCRGMFAAQVAGAPAAAPRADAVQGRHAPARGPARDFAFDDNDRPRRRDREDDYDDRRPRPRDDDDDRRPRRRDDDDEDYPRGRRPRYEDEDDDYDRRPRDERKGWKNLRIGLNLVAIAGWVELAFWGVALLGVGLLVLFGVSVLSNVAGSKSGQGAASSAASGAVGFVGGIMILGLLLLLIKLAEVGLRLTGLGFCMGAPARRGSAMKGLAIAAFSCACAAVAINLAGNAFGTFGNLRGAGGGPAAATALVGGSNVLGWLATLLYYASFFLCLSLMRSVCLNLREHAAAKSVMTLIIAWAVFLGVCVVLVPILICAGGVALFSSVSSNSAGSAIEKLGAFAILVMVVLGLVGLAWLGLYVWYVLLVQQVRGLVDRHLRRS